MSVLVLSRPVFNYVAATLSHLLYTRELSLQTPLCVRHIFAKYNIDTPHQVCRFVALLEAYNADSYVAREKVLLDAPDSKAIEQSTQHYLDFYNSTSSLKCYPSPVGIHQFYKWLCCINYNIDLEGWGARYKDPATQDEYTLLVSLLTDLQHALAAHIVQSLPEYNNAKWSTI